MSDTNNKSTQNADTVKKIPMVDWLDLENNRDKFLEDLRYALADCGFLVLTNAPGLDDEFQQRAFSEVRGFFDRPLDFKKTAAIENSPYVRGYSLPTRGDSGRGQVIESFQYGFDEKPLCAHDDESQPIHERFFRGPNTWPESTTVPGFKPMLEDLNLAYHGLTLQLGELIVESLGEDPAEFRQYFNLEEPYLFASLNHNFSLDAIAADKQDFIREEYKKFASPVTGAHIDGPPFVALLINDRPGLQVVAGEGKWMDAPVTCRTAEGDYDVPVIPGSVIVNTGGSLMHLSEGRYSATLHRVNTTMIPAGDTRVSMPYFLLPKMAGDLIPFGKSAALNNDTVGYNEGRDRGANAAANLMRTYPKLTRRWWMKEFTELKAAHQEEEKAETLAAFKLAKERGERNKAKSEE
ncbi:MAG TPA: isopenicillin N synthase family oxygenase [Gammaproteobacteria bacterium]|nr:isopenicillin N synthase family oxygenase [Gammaproteobacteria bacterium]HIL97474.1 isopenicillin N synthase family oxygenase [Pseudomonadales bacterium]